jgi:hypothetical protein
MSGGGGKSMKEPVQVVIDTDHVGIITREGRVYGLTHDEWHYLCDICADYLGFKRADIEAALKEVTTK